MLERFEGVLQQSAAADTNSCFAFHPRSERKMVSIACFIDRGKADEILPARASDGRRAHPIELPSNSAVTLVGISFEEKSNRLIDIQFGKAAFVQSQTRYRFDIGPSQLAKLLPTLHHTANIALR